MEELRSTAQSETLNEAHANNGDNAADSSHEYECRDTYLVMLIDAQLADNEYRGDG